MPKDVFRPGAGEMADACNMPAGDRSEIDAPNGLTVLDQPSATSKGEPEKAGWANMPPDYYREVRLLF